MSLSNKDSRCWNNKYYTIKQGFNALLKDTHLSLRETKWNYIWNNDGLPKINLFLLNFTSWENCNKGKYQQKGTPRTFRVSSLQAILLNHVAHIYRVQLCPQGLEDNTSTYV